MPKDAPAYDFDTPLSLRNIHCSKWDGMPGDLKGRSDLPEDMIPMWVADMDFAASPEIQAAMRTEAERGYFGYFGAPGPVAETVAGWMSRTHGWEVDTDWIRYTTGVLGGLAIALRAFTEPGDHVIVFSPVYHAFFNKTRNMGREIHESPLVLKDGRFEMDLAALEAALTPRDKMVILCSPHNPGGRIWTPAELTELAEFCLRNDLILVSDEIHMDLTFPGAGFTPTAVAAPQSLPNTVVLTAASKGFNIAGGETAVAIIPDDTLRASFDKSLAAIGPTPNRFGMLMMKAAFAHGDDWSEAVRRYIAGNFEIWRDRIGALPGVTVMDMSATYLSWVDFNGTGMTDAELRERLAMQAAVASSPGTEFGMGGSGCNRFNIAMPRPLMLEAIARIEAAFSDLQ